MVKNISSHAHKTASWYLLGVHFKISNEHSVPFYRGIPLPGFLIPYFYTYLVNKPTPLSTLSGMVPVKMIIFHVLSRLLLEGCPLIAIHKVRYYKRGDGLALGPGPFVTALEFASDVKAEVVGKPQPSFFQQALKEIGCDPQSAVMIGDVSQA